MAYDIEAVRKEYIGREFGKSRGRYPVEHDPIRRHCHMVDDRNPLFLDPEYAAATRWGGVIAPPSGWLAMYFASLGPWPPAFEALVPVVPAPGRRIVNMSQDVEWFDVIRVGDELSVVRRITDVYQKAIGLDPEAVWVVTESTISNQRDETVCLVRNTLIFHRTPEEVAAARETVE